MSQLTLRIGTGRFAFVSHACELLSIFAALSQTRL
jgi:hypothetical protein